MKTQTQNFLPIMIGGCVVLMLGFSVRASFGLFQIPIADDLAWPTAYFSFAIAIQNLAWGFGQPIFGALAERFGDRFAILLGMLCYVTGLALTSLVSDPTSMTMLEVFVGFGIAGMGFGVILAMLGRLASDENRSLVLGIATAAASAGQVVGPPVVAAFLNIMEWRQVFLTLAFIILLSSALVLIFPRHDASRATKKRRIIQSAQARDGRH